jgi:hypothetical protein
MKSRGCGYFINLSPHLPLPTSPPPMMVTSPQSRKSVCPIAINTELGSGGAQLEEPTETHFWDFLKQKLELV